MKVIWFNGNFGNQIFYCAYRDYLNRKYPTEKIYAYIDPRCPPVKVEERTNLSLPQIRKWVSIASFFVFKVLGAFFRRIPFSLVPSWYCGRGKLNDNATFFAHSIQEKSFYENKSSDWLRILEPDSPNNNYLKWKELISASNAVSVHIRRGDYIKPGSSYFDLSTTDYYQRAMDYARTVLPDAKFFFFSDDLDFVKGLFKGDDIFYVDCNKGKDSYLDIKLMSLAAISIMANSTFSYWASYINHENKTVIYPKQWFCDWTGREAPDIMLDKDNWISF